MNPQMFGYLLMWICHYWFLLCCLIEIGDESGILLDFGGGEAIKLYDESRGTQYASFRQQWSFQKSHSTTDTIPFNGPSNSWEDDSHFNFIMQKNRNR